MGQDFEWSLAGQLFCSLCQWLGSLSHIHLELGWPGASNEFIHAHGALVGTAEVIWPLSLFIHLRASPQDLSVNTGDHSHGSSGPIDEERSCQSPQQPHFYHTPLIGQSSHRPCRIKGRGSRCHHLKGGIWHNLQSSLICHPSQFIDGNLISLGMRGICLVPGILLT